MKTVNRIGIAMAMSIAMGLATLSSSASAQSSVFDDCSNLAWERCAWINNRPSFVTHECYLAEYDACLVSWGETPSGPPPIAARRSEVQLA